MTSQGGESGRLTGYLDKRGKLSLPCAWKRFWFVLDGKFLLFYKSKSQYEGLGTCKGCIDFNMAQAVRVCDGSRFKSYQFQVITRTQIIHLSASDDKIRCMWVTALQNSIKPPQVSCPVQNESYHPDKHLPQILGDEETLKKTRRTPSPIPSRLCDDDKIDDGECKNSPKTQVDDQELVENEKNVKCEEKIINNVQKDVNDNNDLVENIKDSSQSDGDSNVNEANVTAAVDGQGRASVADESERSADDVEKPPDKVTEDEQFAYSDKDTVNAIPESENKVRTVGTVDKPSGEVFTNVSVVIVNVVPDNEKDCSVKKLQGTMTKNTPSTVGDVERSSNEVMADAKVVHSIKSEEDGEVEKFEDAMMKTSPPGVVNVEKPSNEVNTDEDANSNKDNPDAIPGAQKGGGIEKHEDSQTKRQSNEIVADAKVVNSNEDNDKAIPEIEKDGDQKLEDATTKMGDVERSSDDVTMNAKVVTSNEDDEKECEQKSDDTTTKNMPPNVKNLTEEADDIADKEICINSLEARSDDDGSQVTEDSKSSENQKTEVIPDAKHLETMRDEFNVGDADVTPLDEVTKKPEKEDIKNDGDAALMDEKETIQKENLKDEQSEHLEGQRDRDKMADVSEGAELNEMEQNQESNEKPKISPGTVEPHECNKPVGESTSQITEIHDEHHKTEEKTCNDGNNVGKIIDEEIEELEVELQIIKQDIKNLKIDDIIEIKVESMDDVTEQENNRSAGCMTSKDDEEVTQSDNVSQDCAQGTGEGDEDGVCYRNPEKVRSGNTCDSLAVSGAVNRISTCEEIEMEVDEMIRLLNDLPSISIDESNDTVLETDLEKEQESKLDVSCSEPGDKKGPILEGTAQPEEANACESLPHEDVSAEELMSFTALQEFLDALKEFNNANSKTYNSSVSNTENSNAVGGLENYTNKMPVE